LRESEERYRAVVEFSPEGVAVSIDEQLVFVNPALVRLMGANDEQQLLGHSIFEFVPPAFHDRVHERRHEVMRARIVAPPLESPLIRVDGSQVDVEVSAVPFTYLGQPAILNLLHDITERKRAEAMLAGQNAVLEAIASGASLPETLNALVQYIEGQSPGLLCSILLLDADGVHLRHGAAPSLPPSFTKAIDGKAIGPSAGSCGTAAHRREPVIVENIATDPLWKDYRDLAVAHSLGACWSTPIFNGQRRLLGTFAVYYRHPGKPLEHHLRLVDVGTQIAAIAIAKHREEVIRRSADERLRACVENTPDVAVQWYDEEGRVVYWNGASERVFGWKSEDAMGKTLDQLIHTPEESAAFRAILKEMKVTGRSIGPVEFVFRRRDRSLGTCLSTIFSIPAPNGDPWFVCMDVDVTELKKAEEESRRSTERLHFALDAAGMDAWEWNLETNEVYWSHLAEGIFGLPKGGFARTYEAYFALIHPEDREGVLQAVDAALKNGTAEYESEHRIVWPDGSIHWIGAKGRVYRDHAGRPLRMAGIIMDITARKHNEEALHESQQRFRQVVENIQEVFWMTDLAENRILYISPGYEKVWGRSRDSLYASPSAWADALHPEDRYRVLSGINVRQTAGTFDETYRILRPDGAIRWVHAQAFPIRNDKGEVYRIAGVAEDVTERTLLEEKFRQSQKMEAIGQLAGGVAHDFNNILAAMMLEAEVASTYDGLPPHVLQLLNDIKVCAERAAGLTRQLLAFSRRQVMQTRRLDLNEVVDSMARMLHRILGEDVRMQVTLHPQPLFVHADAGMLDQVLLNLAINARDAMPGGGRLSIATGERVLSADEARLIPEAFPGRYLRLRVSDTGCGISQDNLPHIFEPFFTTKELGKGTGLGLATVFGIVKQHRGAIVVSSELARGTTFEVLLPANEAALGPFADESAKPASRQGTETILLVEDETEVRMLTRIVLERHGYRVLEAPHGVDALQVWERHAGPIQLLLTDMVLPEGLSGRELAAQLEAHHPALKVIFMSGYSADVAGRELKLRPGHHFLQKPFLPSHLLDMVRSCLDA
jgi:PAS domain S-box-containing protein